MSSKSEQRAQLIVLGEVVRRLTGRAELVQNTAQRHPDPEIALRSKIRLDAYALALQEVAWVVGDVTRNGPLQAPTSPAGAHSAPVGASGGARSPSAPTEAPEGAPLKNVIQSPTGRVKPRLMGCNTHGCMGSVGLSTEVCDECGRVRGAPPVSR